MKAMAVSFLNNSTIRGLRNNNPGNLRRTSNAWQGKVPFAQSKDAEFEQFYEIAWGIRAFFINVETKFKAGQNTLAKFISVYAPSNENNTQAYINRVSEAVGLTSNAQFSLSKPFLITLAKAMFAVELGASNSAKITADNYDDAYFWYENRSFKYGDEDLPELVINSGQKKSYVWHLLAVLALLFFFLLYRNRKRNKRGKRF
jgi:hypothetical protein